MDDQKNLGGGERAVRAEPKSGDAPLLPTSLLSMYLQEKGGARDKGYSIVKVRKTLIFVHSRRVWVKIG